MEHYDRLRRRLRGEPTSIDDEFRKLARRMKLPLLLIDEVLRIHFEEDWREYFEVDQFWPLRLSVKQGGAVLATMPPEISFTSSTDERQCFKHLGR